MTAENCSRPFFCEHQHSSVEESLRPHTKGEVGRAAGEGERQAGWGAGARQGQESCQGLLHKVKVQLPRLPLPPRPLRPHAARTSSRARSPGWLRPRAVRPREGAARCCALRARARARAQRAFAVPPGPPEQRRPPCQCTLRSSRAKGGSCAALPCQPVHGLAGQRAFARPRAVPPRMLRESGLRPHAAPRRGRRRKKRDAVLEASAQEKARCCP